MLVAGIVCEYNPLHTGHAHHLRATRRAGAQAIVCVMSGHFVQRAEPAMLTKWTRAQAAVLCGADLVLELPSRCALQSAEGFAQSAVQLLLAAGAQMLSFGSESADTGSLEQAAQLLCSPRFEPALREGLQHGLSYAAARQQALCALGGDGSLLSCPNDNLAVEYLKAAIRSGRSVTPLAVLRKGAHHKDPQAQPGARFCSASALRRAWREGDRRPWDSAVPCNAKELYRKELALTGGVSFSPMERALLARLRASDKAQLLRLPDASEELCARVLHAARRSSSLEQLLCESCTTRYTKSRVRRLVLRHFLELPSTEPPSFLRVLAFNDTGRMLLRRLREGPMPLVVKPSEHEALLREEARLTELFALFAANPLPCGMEYRTSPRYLRGQHGSPSSADV